MFVDILRAFARRHPQIRMVVRNMGSAEQARAIREERLHVGFVALSIDEPDLATETVLRRPIVLRCRATTRWPTGRASRCTPSPTSRTSCSRGGWVRASTMPCWGRAGRRGFNMHIAHEVDNLHTACALVEAGLGVCFMHGRDSGEAFDGNHPAARVAHVAARRVAARDCLQAAIVRAGLSVR